MNRLLPECPACTDDPEIPPGYIEELVAARRSTGLGLAEEPVYRARLETCAACDSCAGGVMCRKCGCFVALRALNAAQICPHPHGDRWIDI